MATVTQALAGFFSNARQTHNGPDLLDRWTPDLETQVYVSAIGGEPVAESKGTYSDGINKWWNIRIPKGANTNTPVWDDYELTWPIEEYAEAIGCTGWDYRNRCSRWVAYDFDAITGHAPGIGVSETELERIKQAAADIPWVEVRRSTGGNGLHLYVYFDESPQTKNHTEHAALARAVLGLMSIRAGFDFGLSVDICGGNMWIWHRKSSEDNRGLALEKAAESGLTLADLPSNWYDHIDVVGRKRSKVRVRGLLPSDEKQFDELSSSLHSVSLDKEHESVLSALEQLPYECSWLSDHNLAQVHTCALSHLNDDPEWRQNLRLRGTFRTISEGTDPDQPNAFMFPMDDGGWKVFRFGVPGPHEDDTWTQDANGWTTCYFNRTPDLETASRIHAGDEMEKNQGFLFDTLDAAMDAINELGRVVDPEFGLSTDRQTILRANSDDRIIIQVARREDDPKPGRGWYTVKGGSRSKFWFRVLPIYAATPKSQESVDEYDVFARCVTSPSGESTSWMLKSNNGDWMRCPSSDVSRALQSQGKSRQDADKVLGSLALNPWKMVKVPFGTEYPGKREWNLGAPQFRYQPVDLAAVEHIEHPSWDAVLTHCGRSLDREIANNEWFKSNGICTGADYLRTWIAAMVREPFEPLPYLFMFGPENSGKSILWEAIELLITNGVTDGKRVLTNSNEFNGELKNSILAVIEEKDIAVAGESARNRLKELVTARWMSIREMRRDAYMVRNSLHWIHIANHQSYCPVFPGDTRIVVLYVDYPEQEIPKQRLISNLKDEAPHFMRTLCDLTLPPVVGRLRLPIVENYYKMTSQSMNANEVETFLAEHTYDAPGEKVLFADLYNRFKTELGDDHINYARPQFRKMLPQKYPVSTTGTRYVGNLSFTPPSEDSGKRYVVSKTTGYLILETM
jgi:hypothetical protein